MSQQNTGFHHFLGNRDFPFPLDLKTSVPESRPFRTFAMYLLPGLLLAPSHLQAQ